MTHAQILHTLWKDRCTVKTMRKCTDEYNIVTQAWVTVLENEPCRISFSSSTAAMGGGGVSVDTNQFVQLFLRPDADIPPGSRVEVTRNGVTTAYRISGVPARYSDHQEIGLRLEERA